eukprot:405149-Pelagomonas_calceolata.AAC.3
MQCTEGPAPDFLGQGLSLAANTCSQSRGQDRRIMLWNPFSKKSLATLTGHTSSVMSIVVNDNDFQIISLGADKQVKVRQRMFTETVYWFENAFMSSSKELVPVNPLRGEVRPNCSRYTASF